MVTTTRRGNRELLSYSTEELVARWEEFLDEANLAGRITKLADAYPEERSLEVDYGAIDRFDSDLAIYLLDHPQNALYSVEQAIRSFVPPTEEAEIRFRVRGVPRDLRVEVRDLRAKHLGKLVSVEGLVRKATEVRPRLVEAIFQCLRCGAVIKEAQEGLEYHEPLECYEDQGGCSRSAGSTKFKLLDEGSRYIDTQKIEIQEPPEELRGGEAPQRIAGYLEEDLVGLVNPGDRVVFNGVLRGSQRGRFRSKSTLFDIFLNVVGLELEQVEYEEIEITEEDEKRILEEAASGDVIRKIVGSIAPSIYGMNMEKEALALQLFGGVAKELPDGRRIRGDSHILLVGDPGCLVGDERITLGNGTTAKLEGLGTHHLQPISQRLRLGTGGYRSGLATRFHRYEKQPILEVVTESGKCIKGTYNHPLLVWIPRERRGEWRRLDALRIGDRLRVTPSIKCTKRALVRTGWKKPEYYHKSWHVRVPEFVDEKLAAILGYVLGDGWIQDRRVGFQIATEELELEPLLVGLIEEVFGVTPNRQKPRHHTVAYQVDHTPIARWLQDLRVKRIPDSILRSRNSVVSSFLRWLFEADGSCFARGRGRTAITLRSAELELLRDVQILLLRWGVHSRVLWGPAPKPHRSSRGDLIRGGPSGSLVIRQANSMIKFAEKISFASQKKRKRLEDVVWEAEGRSRRWHRHLTERIASIRTVGVETVYDVEVPGPERFIANGIISHNTAKSELLTYIVKLSPRGIYTSGKAATPAGLVAAAVRDEFGEGRWTLEAGALVLADKGLVAIDEIEKMNEQDRSSIHNAMEQQEVHIAKAGITATLQTRTSILAAANPTFGRFDSGKYISEQIQLPPTLLSVDRDEPVMVRQDGLVRTETIGNLVDPYYSEGEEGRPVHPEEGSLEVAAFDPHTFRMSWSPVRYVFRHRHSAPLLRVTLDSGRTVRLTRGHSVYVFENGVVRTKATSQLQPDDYVVIPGSLPSNGTGAPRSINLIRELLRLPEEVTRTVYLHDVPAKVFAQLESEIPKERKYWVHRGILPLRYAAGVDDASLSRCTLVNAGGGRAVRGVMPVNEKLMRFLGYYIAEGSLTISASKSFMISLSFNRTEQEYIEDVQSICQDLFGIEPRTSRDKGAIKVVISNKILYLFLERILRLPRGAWNKRVPDIVFNVPQGMQREFLVGWLRGDRGQTVSRRLASDVLYLLSQNRLVGSLFRIKEHTATFPDGHQATSSSYLLVSPDPYREDRLRNRGRHGMVPYRPVISQLRRLLGAPFAGGYGKPVTDPRLGPSMQRNLLHRPAGRKRLKRLRLLRNPITTSEASMLFEGAAHGEHARAYLQRMNRGWAERERISGKGKAYSWRYRYRLSPKGEKLLADVDRLNRLIDGDLAFARVKSVESVEASGPFVYDLSTPGRENFVAGDGGIVCHNSRFDAIFPILDKPQAQVDRAMAEHILRGHLAGEKIRQAESHQLDARPEEVDETFLPYFEPIFLRKYVAYAKRLYPVLTPEAMELIQDKYLEIRKQGEGESGTVPITPRQLEAFIRLAEASARARLSRKVEEEDAERSVHILEYWLERVTGIEGGFDIDIVATGLSQSQRAQMIALREIIGELAERDGAAVLKDILEAAEERGVPPNRVEAWLKRWSQEGEVYSPAPNKWRLVSRF